jgi:WD40 repeat protein
MEHSPEGLRVVLDFLHSQQYFKALLALEQESGERLRSYGKELDFFYDLISEGRFDDAERFIQPLCNRYKEKHSQIVFQIRKAKFLEQIEASTNPNVEELVTLLRDLENLAPREELSKLFYCLNLSKLQDSPEFRDWNQWKGRATCFEECLACLGNIYSVPPAPELTATLSQLLALNSPRRQSGSPSKHRASSRYSADSDPRRDNSYETSVVINDSESTERELKQKSWVLDPRGINEALQEVEGLEEESFEEDMSLQTTDLMSRFSPTTLREVAVLTDKQPIRTSAFSSKGDFFVMGTNSKCLKICSIEQLIEGVLADRPKLQEVEVCLEARNLHFGSVYCVDWSANGEQIASGSNDKTIKVLSCRDYSAFASAEPLVWSNGRYLKPAPGLPELHETLLAGHQATVRTVCFSPQDDRTLLSGGIVDCDIKVWNTEVGSCVQRLQGHQGAVYSISASGDGKFFVSVGTDRKIFIWDLRTRRQALVLNAESFAEINAVALNCTYNHVKYQGKVQSTQKLAAVGHCDGLVSLWDITGGKLFTKFLYHSTECRSVEFSPDANWLVSASFDSSIGIVDLNSTQTYKLEQHQDRVVCARWHPSLPVLLSTSADKTVRLFS